MKNISKMAEDGFIWALMVSIGVVNIIQITQILLRFEKVKLEQGLGQRIQESTTMLLMESLEACGELEEEYQANYVA